MRELDAILQSFLSTVGPTLDTRELGRFAAILELPDPELHAYLSGRRAPPDADIARLIERIRASHRPET